MRYLTFCDQPGSEFPVAILSSTLRQDEMAKAYLTPFGLSPDMVIALQLHQSEDKKKTPAAEIKEYIASEILPTLADCKTQYVVCTDSDYFKILTKTTKVDAHLGYIMDSPFGDFKVVYAPNYRQIFYDPDRVKSRIAQAMEAIKAHATGSYEEPGNEVIRFEEYPTSYEAIAHWLQKILDMNCPVAIDIETFSLKHHSAGIGTISICWSQHEGIAFPVDYVPLPEKNEEGHWGYEHRNEKLRLLLQWFFEELQQTAYYHHIAFDVYVLIYQLYMNDICDTAGLLQGIEVLLRDWECTKLITYLATNSCAGNDLSLKTQAQEFAGNYAMEDIKDIRRIPMFDLLRYNLVDGLSTHFTKNKHWHTMVADQQLEIYQQLFKPATIDIIQMQLTGMPLNMERVKKAKADLQKDQDSALKRIRSSSLVQEFTHILNQDWVDKRNAKLKKKRVTIAEANETFNPNSNPQLQKLLFEMCKLPILGYTDSKQPATDGDSLKALRNHTKEQRIIDFLNAMLDYGAVTKILSSFIPAMEAAPMGPDGWHYMSGNFNLGGTLSGRLSSSDPNLQNLPANSRYGKMIKSCFQAPPGCLFGGLDFDSLEDKISALTTKDPQKLKVYTDGYDGHCLRAYAYFGENMPDIDPGSVQSINSIQDKYGSYRQDSKVPTFLLTYDGTFKGMMEQCGFDMEKAKTIEARYHELYHVSDEWKKVKLDQAMTDGYVTVAFGLRVRTPLLKQVIRGTSKTPFEAEAEGRTAGNALGQSWCLLNSRAWVEFMRKVRASKFRLAIRPCAQIHDAGYCIFDEDIEVLMFINEHLVKAVKWQEHPDIQHDEVKLGGKFGIFYPSWKTECTLPNNATQEEIFLVIENHMAKLQAA